jgi:hypothetical protein
MPGAPAEREAADTRGADDSDRHGQAVLVRRRVELGQQSAALDAHRPRGCIDRDPVHLGEIDHDPIVDASEPAAVVSAAADGDAKLLATRVLDRGRDVPLADAIGDRRRTPIDHGVEERS